MFLAFMAGCSVAFSQDCMPYKNFALRDTSGTVHQLREYVQANRCVLVSFWASWCSPCRRETSQLRSLRMKYGKLGFEVVGVSLDTSAEQMAEAMGELSIDWPQLTDLRGWKNCAAREYGVEYVPYCVLISADEGILYTGSVSESMERIIKEKTITGD